VNTRFDIGPDLDRFLSRWTRIALGGGGFLFLACIAGGFFAPAEFFHAYLFAYLFWLGVSLGSLALLMTQYLTGGAWGVMSRRTLEAAVRTLPLMALLFIPIAIGIPHLYPWAHAADVFRDDVMRHRAGYMNPPFFIVRAVLYFAIWLTLAWFLIRWSREEDEGRDRLRRFERLSAPGLILYVFTVTFSAIDWAESLFPHWFSTMWGFLFVAGQGLSALGVTILVVSLLARFHPFSEALHASHLHDLGKLLLMFVMLWAYFSFSQLLIVWSGNLTTEIPWYFTRWHGSWAVIGILIALFEFLVPFLLLLSRALKRNPAALGLVVALLLVMRIINLYWIVIPGLDRGGLRINWMQFVAPLALGGLWTGAFFWQLRKRPLIPVGAPNLEEALTHAESAG
jgi:hypothetical protein